MGSVFAPAGDFDGASVDLEGEEDAHGTDDDQIFIGHALLPEGEIEGGDCDGLESQADDDETAPGDGADDASDMKRLWVAEYGPKEFLEEAAAVHGICGDEVEEEEHLVYVGHEQADHGDIDVEFAVAIDMEGEDGKSESANGPEGWPENRIDEGSAEGGDELCADVVGRLDEGDSSEGPEDDVVRDSADGFAGEGVSEFVEEDGSEEEAHEEGGVGAIGGLCRP